MLEQFIVFTKSGFVLWQFSATILHGNPINELIKAVLLEERAGLDSYSYEAKYLLKWTQANECNLVFVAVYQKILPLPYVDDLLNEIKKAFVDTFGPNLKPFGQTYTFEKQFDSILKEVQSRFQKSKETKKPAPFEQSSKFNKLKAAGKGNIQQQPTTNKPSSSSSPPSSSSSSKAKEPETNNNEPGPTLESLRETQGSPQKSPSIGGGGSSKLKLTSPVPNVPVGTKRRINKKKMMGKKDDLSSEPAPGTKRVKAKRNWDGDEDVGNLNFSANPTTTATDQAVSETDWGVGEKVVLDPSSESESSTEEEQDDSQEQQSTSTPSKRGGLLQYLTNFINRELTEKDLEPVMEQISNHLITKNVAAEISEKLCASVTQNLIGKHLGTFERVKTAVSEAMETALIRILTPKRQIDVLREARAAKEKNRPYVIVFVGVNGVGKSTSLAKVCSWLLQNDLSVMIAACDTFRAGAVEQLQVHAKNLKVHVFHRGYGKDPAGVASEAIVKATNEKTNVILVDTAGRMQDNEPLMRALAKLVGVNQPDLVLFVGEALVGNEAVDQLTKFNRALEEFGAGANPRGIDGIFLTKFDTVDEKVGAAISMVYTTGQPIVFVGVGQKYSDLRQLNVQRIVSVLLKGH